MFLLVSLSHDLQCALGWFLAGYEAAGLRVSTSKYEAKVLSQKSVVCFPKVGNEILPQAEKFNHLRIMFMGEGRMEQSLDRQIGAVSAVMWILYQSVVLKREWSLKVKLSIYQSIYIQTLTYGHKLRLLTV